MNKKIIIGNWKMHGSAEFASDLASHVMPHARKHANSAQVVFAPPFPYLAPLQEQLLDNALIGLCAQDCSAHEEGAFTGEVSANMLAEWGCRYVIIGHSERRLYHKETDELVQDKMLVAMKAGLIPVVCVGESLAERESKQHLAVVETQLKRSVLAAGYPAQPFIIAYEPVWAIGTGKTASLDDITQMHKHIASVLSYAKPSESMNSPVFYGGSVKPANAIEILSLSCVDGVLVGGASLKAEEFNAIISATG